MGFLDFIYRNHEKKLKLYLKKGAIILDIRDEKDFKKEGIFGAKNIPLEELQYNIHIIKQWQKPVIVCAENGTMSNQGAKFLFLENIEAISGGGYKRLQYILSSI
ncbi:rhodanese-like domain-containing protein [Zhouia sp. PK063]|uniref:rhodanese-like domain-containing protein n=1 Tax=Zhouia sp. PK063 TaxID=3373602 RepID=UPI003792CAB4